MQKYDANMRSLLREAYVAETETVAVNTASGAHLTADCILDPFEERNRKRIAVMNPSSVHISKREQQVKYPESPI